MAHIYRSFLSNSNKINFLIFRNKITFGISCSHLLFYFALPPPSCRYLCILTRESTISGNLRGSIDKRRVTNSWTSRCRSTAPDAVDISRSEIGVEGRGKKREREREREGGRRGENVERIDKLALPRYVGCRISASPLSLSLFRVLSLVPHSFPALCLCVHSREWFVQLQKL